MTSHVVPHGLAQPCSTALLLSTFISCLNPRPPATREILTHTRAHSLKHTAPKHVQRHTHTDTQRSVFNKFFSSDKAKIKMPWQSVRACAFLCVQLDARGRQASGSCWSVCVVPLHGIMSAEHGRRLGVKRRRGAETQERWLHEHTHAHLDSYLGVII